MPTVKDAVMWEWILNWNELRSDLVIGSCPMTAEDIAAIQDGTGVTALLSLQSDECRSAFSINYEAHRNFAKQRSLAMVNTPMRDFDPPDQRRALPEAVQALTTLLSTGHKIYLYCTAGINRAPLAALAYFSFVERVEEEEAIAFIRRSRPYAEPSWEAYWGCREDLAASLKPHVYVRAYYLAEQSPGTKPERNWYEAEADVIRQAFLSPRSLPFSRLDPSRA